MQRGDPHLSYIYLSNLTIYLLSLSPIFLVPTTPHLFRCKMPPKAKKDKLTEKQDKPPHNSPHHRTSNPRTSAIRSGSDAGMDPLPSVPPKPVPSNRTRPLSQQPARPYSPRPDTRRPSTTVAPKNGGKREAKRAASHDASASATWRPLQGTDGQNMKKSFSHEVQPRRNHRKVDNITQAINMTQVPRPNHLHEPVFIPTHAIPTFVPHATWPEILHSQESPPSFGSHLAPDQERELLHQRQRYLKYCKATLEISTLHALLGEFVAPLNPVLAVPAPPYHLIGTRFERLFQDSDWMMSWREKRSALPGLVWDVRDRPDVYGDGGLRIAAWPYATSFEEAEERDLGKKEMRTRVLLVEGEVRKLCGQTVTNPPSSVSSHIFSNVNLILKRA
jgi:hypothetical protein